MEAQLWGSFIKSQTLSKFLAEEPSDADDIQSLMWRAMKQIEESFEAKTWQAFWRTTVDGLTTAVVAAELELSPASVRQARSRVLRRLRQQLGDLD